jgi:PHD/YefM family antitoxin component YafN of YafNO toxin-antitoxin module
MNHINLKDPNPTLVDLIDKVNQSQEATLITIDEQKQAVLVSLEEWKGLQETLYLSSIPGVKDDLIAGKNTSWEDCVPLEKVEW